MQDPSRYLSRISSSHLQRVPEFVPGDKKGHEWQADAFAFNRLIPEVGFLHDTTSKLVAACDLVPMVETDDPDEPMAEAKDVRVNRVMKAFVGAVGGQRELKRRAALHVQVAGESILLASPIHDEYGDEKGLVWEFLSPREVTFERKRQADGTEKTTIKRSSRGAVDGEVTVDAHASRFYRPDAEFSGLADSPLRRVLPLCRQLLVLMEVVDAVAKQRLSAGILFVPEELSFGPDDEVVEGGADDDEADIDPFTAELISHVRAPIEDRTSAASLVPLIVRGPAEVGEKIKLVMLAEDLDTAFQDLRGELLTRIAQGLDAPPEVLTGKSSLNHWSAYSVDSDFVDNHVAPIGMMLAEFLTVAYLRPMLVQKEAMDPAEAERYSLHFDPSPLAQRSDEGSLATNGWDRGTISDAAWLAANGFSEADLPSDEERQRRMLEKIVLANPSLAPALLPLLFPDNQALADALAAVPVAQPTDPALAPSDPSPLRPVAEPPRPALADAEIPLVDRLATAADAALDRALERAGSRAVSALSRTDHRDDFASVDKRAVYGALTDAHRQVISRQRVDLVGDAWDGFAERATSWIVDWAIAEGMTTFCAQEVARDAVLAMVRDLDAMLRDGSLARSQVLSSGLRIPTDLIHDALSAAFMARRAS